MLVSPSRNKQYIFYKVKKSLIVYWSYFEFCVYIRQCVTKKYVDIGLDQELI